MPLCLFIAALCSPFWKKALLWALVYVMFSCVFATLPCGVLGQVWYLIVAISDLCLLTYFKSEPSQSMRSDPPPCN